MISLNILNVMRLNSVKDVQVSTFISNISYNPQRKEVNIMKENLKMITITQIELSGIIYEKTRDTLETQCDMFTYFYHFSRNLLGVRVNMVITMYIFTFYFQLFNSICVQKDMRRILLPFCIEFILGKFHILIKLLV